MKGLGAAVAALLLVTACGSVPHQGGAASPAAPGSSTPSALSASPSPAPTPSGWSTYTDPDYGFSISYPPGLVFVPEHGDASVHLLMAYRFVASEYLSGYPAGQIEAGIYAQDADTISAWVSKHSGSQNSGPGRLFYPPTNQSPQTVAGREGLAFDWIPDTNPNETIHSWGVLNAAHVFVIDWWSTDSSYATTIHSYYDQMLATLQFSK